MKILSWKFVYNTYCWAYTYTNTFLAVLAYLFLEKSFQNLSQNFLSGPIFCLFVLMTVVKLEGLPGHKNEGIELKICMAKMNFIAVLASLFLEKNYIFSWAFLSIFLKKSLNLQSSYNPPKVNFWSRLS